MTKDEARKKLEEQRKLMQEQSHLHEQVEQALDKNKKKKKNSKLSGPRNDLEYQKMLNDMKESGNESDDK